VVASIGEFGGVELTSIIDEQVVGDRREAQVETGRSPYQIVAGERQPADTQVSYAYPHPSEYGLL
jgi:hypothetical protein